MEDVQEEIAYWHNAVVCFILGANPPPSVIEGLIRRIWTRFNIDKLSFLPNGIFLVCFKSLEMKEQVLQAGHYLFDNKPMIVNPWSEELKLHKPEVKSVPVWIQLHGLPIKFWGKSLPKIAGLVGKFIKFDIATEQKTKLGYARTMVEMVVDHVCPDHIQFKDELGIVQTIGVTYEWKPITCSQCKGMGHSQEDCRKGKPTKPKNHPEKKTQAWIPVSKANDKTNTVAKKQTEPAPTTPAPLTSEEGQGGTVLDTLVLSLTRRSYHLLPQ
ncbi:hypothetical protein vseg_003481 [Gypsophila vaccaria]